MSRKIRGRFLAVARWPAIDALLLGVLCVAAALTALGSWRADLHVPYLIQGDAAATQYLIKTVLDHGSYLTNPDVGAPFGATMYDFPIPEPTNFGIVRALGLFSHDPFLVYNLFYLLSFASVGIAAWWGFRRLGVDRPLSFAGGFLFSMLAYHFFRLPHLFLASYFAVPIFATCAAQLALYRAPHLARDLRLSWGWIALLAVAAGAGIYYAFFGCLFIAMGGAIGASAARRKEPLLLAAAYLGIIIVVVGLSLAPNALYHWTEGANALVAQRNPDEAETYGLRLTQLLLPAEGHRLAWFAQWIAKYDATAPLLTENKFATLGVLGSVGLLASIACCLLLDRARVRTEATLGTLSIGGILFATIGGFGSLFALLVTPDMRGLNRISVFIAFFALAAMLILAQRGCRAKPLACGIAAFLMLVIGWFDEVPTTRLASPDSPVFRTQQAFFRQVQDALPQGTRVFELPYRSFPESPWQPVSGPFFSYDLFWPYLQTHGLRWSFGDMRGRPADAWNEETSTLRGAELVRAVESAGFGAIYINRAGFGDHAAAMEATLAPVLGRPTLEDSSRSIALYVLPAHSPPMLPFIVVAPGRGWNTAQKEARQNPPGWANGSADLLLANPGAASHVLVQFSATSPTKRDLRVHYGDLQLGIFGLAPGKATGIELHFVADAGVSRISIDTDERGPNAFRLENLEYGATAFK